jgi:signal transduction histidine kinase
MIFPDVQTDPLYQRLSRSKTSGRWGYRFFAAFPLKSKERTLGTINCIGTDRRELTDGEIQLLEAISDQLAVAIENSELYHDVRLKVDELQRKTSELEQANSIKDDFLSVISHELRTPINVIMGYTSLFNDGVLGEIKPEQQEAVAKIARETKNLLEMINTLLFATTLETGQITIESQEFKVDSLMEELRTNYTATAPTRVIMEWQCPADLPGLNTDRRKLKQILDNLIGNAIKFTEEGSVTIAVRVADRREHSAKSIGSACDPPALSAQPLFLEFTVSDTGVGIPGEKLDKIFDKFYQADSSGTRSFGGVGLGLYIAKKFTELLGGRLSVASTEGVGSTFTLTVPLRA